MKKIVVFTGAGISAESGISTFRGSGGLWENNKIDEVATPEAWKRDPKLVLEFYNKRREQVCNAKPNDAHKWLVKLEKQYDVTIITQNIDDLHKRAGSSKILHLHGEIMKSRSTVSPFIVYDIKGRELNYNECCEKGSQLRPHIVWFGEQVPNMDVACEITSKADIFIIIGTSLSVYPAAGLVEYTSFECEKFLIDPEGFSGRIGDKIEHIQLKATEGTKILVNRLLERTKKRER